MWRAYKKKSGNERNSEDGFALVAALIAVMILMAVGIYALTTSSQDIRATAKSVSEGNALSAAEAGVHTLAATFNPSALADIPKTAVQGSANASFNVQGQRLTDTIPCYACSGGWQFFIYDTQVTGFDNILNGQVTVRIGVMDPTPRM